MNNLFAFLFFTSFLIGLVTTIFDAQYGGLSKLETVRDGGNANVRLVSAPRVGTEFVLARPEDGKTRPAEIDVVTITRVTVFDPNASPLEYVATYTPNLLEHTERGDCLLYTSPSPRDS